MSRKIAPNVQGWLGNGEFDCPGLEREMRALISVARAVKRESEEFVALSRLARGAMPSELDGDEVGRRVENIADRLGQAIRRLDKASATPRGDR